MAGGTIYLKHPAGQGQELHYGSPGFGFGAIKKIPKVPKLHLPKTRLLANDPGVTGAASTFTGGTHYMTSAFHGKELRRSDLTGGTVCFDVGAGVIAKGASATVRLLGINTALLAMGIVMPQFFGLSVAVHSAPARSSCTGLTLVPRGDIIRRDLECRDRIRY
ncbi:hypothetical protein [Paraburkholderia tropica]|uniref:hypothetical protein n=1 Tax=Paraburkholderia tropica TaxID=92647 RepID=UPI002AB654B7|nr:hypothetical protein [Paraburkholderia tropica]